MKKLITLLLLLSSFIMMSQDKVTVKTICNRRHVVGYLIVYVNKEHKATKTIRVDSFEELQSYNVMRRANGLIHHRDIPKDLLTEEEYIKNGAYKK